MGNLILQPCFFLRSSVFLRFCFPKARMRTQTVPPTMAYEFVIAHHKENLDWLAPVADYCHVYDKGHEAARKPSFHVMKWEELPNVGREAHTYLHHIIWNYEHLANITVFLQGQLTDHAPDFCFQTPMEFLERAKKGVRCIVKGKYSDWGRIPHVGKWKKAWDSGLMRHANRSVGQFYHMAFRRAPPTSVDVCLAGCFSATRRCLLQHPKEFYQRMISTLSDHSDPEEVHYIERLWFTITSC